MMVQINELKEAGPEGSRTQDRMVLKLVLKEFCDLRAHPMGWQDIHAMDEDLIDRALSCLKG